MSRQLSFPEFTTGHVLDPNPGSQPLIKQTLPIRKSLDGNESLPCAEEWKKLKGKTKIDAQREFIHHTNKMLTRYGWNPPEGWV
ncbi:unnamed protein product [Nippostrongylus brasiliensis]|uniref:ACB domain-containing protein n=1 Tax=Nippostrongylus brasiliensis TaxID=27835 RepID=A0A0N4YU65_NIPBR|nr:unnamed protein product [Nippostrongylus brasiliensis]